MCIVWLALCVCPFVCTELLWFFFALKLCVRLLLCHWQDHYDYDGGVHSVWMMCEWRKWDRFWTTHGCCVCTHIAQQQDNISNRKVLSLLFLCRFFGSSFAVDIAVGRRRCWHGFCLLWAQRWFRYFCSPLHAMLPDRATRKCLIRWKTSYSVLCVRWCDLDIWPVRMPVVLFRLTAAKAQARNGKGRAHCARMS